jgi:hypothetical protein
MALIRLEGRTVGVQQTPVLRLIEAREIIEHPVCPEAPRVFR